MLLLHDKMDIKQEGLHVCAVHCYIGATLKKKCFLYSGWPKLWPVGRPQNLFFPVFSSFLGGKKIVKKILKKFNKLLKMKKKKKVPVGPHRLTRPLDRKQHFFQGWHGYHFNLLSRIYEALSEARPLSPI